jgi:hypothetical protein
MIVVLLPALVYCSPFPQNSWRQLFDLRQCVCSCGFEVYLAGYDIRRMMSHAIEIKVLYESKWLIVNFFPSQWWNAQYKHEQISFGLSKLLFSKSLVKLGIQHVGDPRMWQSRVEPIGTCANCQPQSDLGGFRDTVGGSVTFPFCLHATWLCSAGILG